MQETGWLIELETPEGAKWFTVNNNFTNNPDETLRFARQQDAEAGIKLLGLDIGCTLKLQATEYIWYSCVITKFNQASEQAAKERNHEEQQ